MSPWISGCFLSEVNVKLSDLLAELQAGHSFRLSCGSKWKSDPVVWDGLRGR